MSLVGGIRGEWNNGLTYDFSARHGENEIQYTLKNTINPRWDVHHQSLFGLEI